MKRPKSKGKGRRSTPKSNPGLTGRQLVDSMVGGLSAGRPQQFGRTLSRGRPRGR